jgi:hypothetical protein
MDDLLKVEQYFLDSYKPYFNTYMTAGSTRGTKTSDETKRKQSLAKKGKSLLHFKGIKHTEEQIEKQRSKIFKRSVLQFNKVGDLIKEWDSVRRAAITIKKDPRGIHLVAQGKRKTFGGFVWKYKVA